VVPRHVPEQQRDFDRYEAEQCQQDAVELPRQHCRRGQYDGAQHRQTHCGARLPRHALFGGTDQVEERCHDPEQHECRHQRPGARELAYALR